MSIVASQGYSSSSSGSIGGNGDGDERRKKWARVVRGRLSEAVEETTTDAEAYAAV
jgi:hypothetical protein